MPRLDDAQMAARREEIIDATFSCLTKFGVANTSIQTICKEAGISSGAIYVHFKNKEAVIAGVLEQQSQRWLMSMSEKPAHASVDVAAAFLKEMKGIRSLTASTQIGRANIELMLMGMNSPELKPSLTHSFESMRKAVVDGLEKQTGLSGAAFDSTVEIIYGITVATFLQLQLGMDVKLGERADAVRHAVDVLMQGAPRAAAAPQPKPARKRNSSAN
jgi:AcrR family transcriptional regulator